MKKQFSDRVFCKKKKKKFKLFLNCFVSFFFFFFVSVVPLISSEGLGTVPQKRGHQAQHRNEGRVVAALCQPAQGFHSALANLKNKSKHRE